MTFVIFLLVACVLFLFISFCDSFTFVKMTSSVNGQDQVQYLLASKVYENPRN
jgi:hypothetical protein